MLLICVWAPHPHPHQTMSPREPPTGGTLTSDRLLGSLLLGHFGHRLLDSFLLGRSYHLLMLLVALGGCGTYSCSSRLLQLRVIQYPKEGLLSL
jgi:hypothetical protein